MSGEEELAAFGRPSAGSVRLLRLAALAFALRVTFCSTVGRPWTRDGAGETRAGAGSGITGWIGDGEGGGAAGGVGAG